MKEITICIPTWGRHEIFSIVAKQLSHLQKVVIRYNLNVMVGLSPNEDIEEQFLYSICLKHGFGFCTHGNELLGAKHNHIIKSAFQSFPATDYIMNLGSDDLLHESLFDLYYDYAENEVIYFGVDTCYFWNKITNEAIRFRYDERNFVIGAGRMLHKSIFKVIPNIYTDNVTSSLDSNSFSNMKKVGFEKTKIKIGDFPYIVDIKANNNINTFNKIKELVPQSCTDVSPKEIIQLFDLVSSNSITVNSCNMEFGYELISALPYAYWLYERGLLKETISGKGSEALYYFSPKHTINRNARKYENIKKAIYEKIPNVNIHKHFLDHEKFKIPDYSTKYANKEYKFKKPTVCICNRYNIEWGSTPINFFSIECLDEMFTMLKEQYQVIYWAVDIPRDLQDGVEPLKLNDRELIKNVHPEILIFQDLCKDKDFNEIQLKIFTNCRKYITMNGGYAILASFFGGQNIIYSHQGQRQTKEINLGSFQRWYPNFANTQIKYVEKYSRLYDAIRMLYINKQPTVNILIRTCQRPNFLKTCVESIERQDYPNINIIIGVEREDAESLKYLIKYKYRTVTYGQVREVPEKPSNNSEYGVYFPFNHYLDEMNKMVGNGYIMYLDDDDYLTDSRSVSKIMEKVSSTDDIIYWRCKFGNRVIPSNEHFNGKPICCDISGIGFLFHSKFINQIEWGYWKRGDYRVAEKLYRIGRAKFINEVLSGIQTEAHSGKIVDKKTQEVNNKPLSNHVVICESLHRKFGPIGSEHPMERNLAETLQRQGYIKILR